MIERVSERVEIHHERSRIGSISVFEDTTIAIDGVIHPTTTQPSYKCEGNLLTAAKILEPYDNPDAPKTIARLRNEREKRQVVRTANLIAERVKPASSFAPFAHDLDQHEPPRILVAA